MYNDLDVLGLLQGLSRAQAERFRECTLSILPALRRAVIENVKDERRNPPPARVVGGDDDEEE